MSKLNRNEVFHFRLGQGKETQAKAGATVVFSLEKKRFGIALCCEKDRYCKMWGRKIATHRAETGEKSRIRASRFNSAPEYKGELEFEQVRQEAERVVLLAAINVDNPIRAWLV